MAMKYKGQAVMNIKKQPKEDILCHLFGEEKLHSLFARNLHVQQNHKAINEIISYPKFSTKITHEAMNDICPSL